MNKREFLGGIVGASLVTAVPRLSAQTRAVVQLVVPFQAGGLADSLARLLALNLQNLRQRSVVVINRPGASGIVAVSSVMRSRPDEASFLLTSNAQLMQPLLADATASVKEVFDGLRYAGILCELDSFMLVPGTAGVKTAAEFLAKNRSSKKVLNMGSQGTGSTGHLLGAALAHEWKLDMVHVPYNGSPAITRGLLSGDIDYAFMNYLNFQSHITTGAVVPLAVASDRRSNVLPSVPTAVSVGLKSINRGVWFAMTHASHIEPMVVSDFMADISAVMIDPRFREKAAEMGLSIHYKKGEAAQNFIDLERQFWSKMIRDFL